MFSKFEGTVDHSYPKPPPLRSLWMVSYGMLREINEEILGGIFEVIQGVIPDGISREISGKNF